MNKKELAFSKLAQNCRPLTPEEMEQVSGGNQHYTIRYPTTHVTGTRINHYTTSQAAAYYSSPAFYATIGGIAPQPVQFVLPAPETGDDEIDRGDPLNPDPIVELEDTITDADGNVFGVVVTPSQDGYSEFDGVPGQTAGDVVFTAGETTVVGVSTVTQGAALATTPEGAAAVINNINATFVPTTSI